jgi:hypothetical protein
MRSVASIVAVLVLASLFACGPARITDSGVIQREAGPGADAAAWLTCQPGQQRCYQNSLHQTCMAAGEFTTVETEDCTANGQICVDGVWCVTCRPNSTRCSDDETAVEVCAPDGSAWSTQQMCNLANGEACRNAVCVVLCNDGSIANTNIGCEYYAAQLDNAQVPEGNAAAQQYAVVVSNPDQHLTSHVRIEWNTAPVGMPPRPTTVASAVIAPGDLEAFPLPTRVVDCGDPSTTLDMGPGTCLSSHAYHIVSTIPVIAYQFNPFQNSNVFSNDASLLLPTNSINGDYVVIGWPQTIAATSNAMTNFDVNLRAYVTIVGTTANTHIQVTPTANVIPGGTGGVLPMGNAIGHPFQATLGPFDVLNIESGAFHADFTGTRITTDNPIAVFTGDEAADAPVWDVLAERLCCADHQEEQMAPRRTAASDFVAVRMSSRTRAVSAAGGMVSVVTEPQFFRIMSAGDVPTHVTTTLPSNASDPSSLPIQFNLQPQEQRTLTALQDFEIHGDGPLFVIMMTGGQETTGIPFGMPGGDPSMITVPPVLQWRQNYVFLTPDKYSFDFVTIVARPTANVQLDGTPLPFADCPMYRADACVNQPDQPPCPTPNYVVYRCQLSFPIIDPSTRPATVRAGRQQDGVHTVTSDDAMQGVMVLVNGFDSYVGYGYPAGTRTMTVD